MLTTAKYCKEVPRDLVKNLKFREQVLVEAGRSLEVQRELIAACRQDIVFYINVFGWQFNPKLRSGPQFAPFITYEFQDEAIYEIDDAVESQDDLVIEKSRDVGISWLCLFEMDWRSRFWEWQKFLCVSRNAEAVDEPDDSDSLFWKLDHIQDNLPGWLRMGRERKRMRVIYPQTHSAITAQAATTKAGVGGRCTAMFNDEFASNPAAQEILDRTADTTYCRIFNSTHVGTETPFNKLCQRENVRKLRLHWSRHPLKNQGLYRFNEETGQREYLDPQYEYPPDYFFIDDGKLRSPWYDAECVRRNNARAVAMDLDINPEGSVSQFFDPERVRAIQRQYWRPPVWQGDIYYDRSRAEPLQIIPLKDGPLRLWFHPQGERTPVPESLYKAGSDISNGTGATPSCLSIVDCHLGEQVAEYVNSRVSPEEFAQIAVALCRMFHEAEYAWEMAGPGQKHGLEVLKLGYANVYYRIDKFAMKAVQSDKPGWYPNTDTKRLLLEDLRSAMYANELLVRSETAYKEMLGYHYSGNGQKVTHDKEQADDPAEATVNHGDRVVALGLAWMLAREIVPRGAAPVVDEAPVGSLAWRIQLAEEKSRDSDRELWIT